MSLVGMPTVPAGESTQMTTLLNALKENVQILQAQIKDLSVNQKTLQNQSSNTPITTTIQYYPTNGTWSTINSINNARLTNAGCGSVTSALCIGGVATAFLSTVENFNGTAWSTLSGGISVAKNWISAAGTASSALAYGGYNGSAQSGVDSFNGSSWTTGTGLPVTTWQMAGFGSSNTSAFMAGGISSSGITSSTYTYNGTVWNSSASMPSSICTMGGCGTSAAGLVCGGYPNLANTYIYNGTTWSAVSSLSLGRECLSVSGGTNTDCISVGGNDSSYMYNKTEYFNGSTWAATGNLVTTISRFGISGNTVTNNVGAITMGGGTDVAGSTYTAICQLFTTPHS